MKAITLFVSIEFWQPVCLSRLRCMRQFASLMCVPEAAVHEDDLAPSAKDEIWSAGEFVIVQPIPVT